MKDGMNSRRARAQMETAKERSENTLPNGQRLPRRYKLYDKIKDNVSLRTVDTVIWVTAALIVFLLIYGIATGTPPQ